MNHVLLLVATVMACVSFAAADDDKSYPIVYACLGITVVGAAVGLIYAYFRPLEVDVPKVQAEAMIERRPPGFLKYCMESRTLESSDSEAQSVNAEP